MQTIERPETPHAPSGDTKLKRRNRLLTWLVAILAVAVVGLGAWLIVEVTAGSEGATPPGAVQAVLDDYLAAWETNDSDLFRATTAEDYTFTSNGAEISRTAQAITVGRPGNFRVEQYDQYFTGQGPYYVSQPSRIQTIPNGLWYEGQSIIEVEEIDGAWKVASHYWIGDL